LLPTDIQQQHNSHGQQHYYVTHYSSIITNETYNNDIQLQHWLASSIIITAANSRYNSQANSSGVGSAGCWSQQVAQPIPHRIGSMRGVPAEANKEI
jgi:hypothetical protein